MVKRKIKKNKITSTTRYDRRSYITTGISNTNSSNGSHHKYSYKKKNNNLYKNSDLHKKRNGSFCKNKSSSYKDCSVKKNNLIKANWCGKKNYSDNADYCGNNFYKNSNYKYNEKCDNVDKKHCNRYDKNIDDNIKYNDNVQNYRDKKKYNVNYNIEGKKNKDQHYFKVGINCGNSRKEKKNAEKNVKNRNQQTEIIYGRNACFGCFENFKSKKINGFSCREIYNIYILQSKFDEYYKLLPDELKTLAQKCNSHDMFVVTHENDKHQGVAIEASKYQFADIETVINIIARNIDNKNDEANIFHGSESRENEENTTNEDNNKDCKDGEPSKNCKKNSNDKEKNKNSKKNFKNKKRDQKNDDSKNNESIKESDEDVITTGIVHDVSETQIAPQMMTLNKKISSIFFLDHVQDPHNVGNIIRSAFCFNVDAIILTERNACGITSAVVRSSAGYSECSLICKVNNTINAIEKLKKVGYLIIGFDSNATEKNKLDTIIGKYDKYVFIFGSEGDGMKDLTKKYCDFLVKLPMNPNAESLNVANTATIVGWEIMKHNADNDNSK